MFIIKLFTTPIVLTLVLLGIGLVQTRRVRQTRGCRAGWWLLLLGTVLLLVLSLRPVAHLLTYSVAHRYQPVSVDTLSTLDLVVVLGGGMSGWENPSRPPELSGPAYGRWFHGVEVFKAGRSRLLVFCGGRPREDVVSEAQVMKAMALAMAIPEDRILVETESRNTMENAAELAKRLPPGTGRRIGLVTSATHMWRSEKVFRKHFPGDTIVPLPVYDAYGSATGWKHLVPTIGALDQSSKVVHEWVGLLWHSLRY